MKIAQNICPSCHELFSTERMPIIQCFSLNGNGETKMTRICFTIFLLSISYNSYAGHQSIDSRSNKELVFDELSDEEYQRLHDALQPANETWKSIPWKISLLDAQRTAATEKKPIFIWAMDGHPLGCT